MKNLSLSPKSRTSFAIACFGLGVLLAAVMAGASGDESQKASSTKQGFTETLPGGVKLEMVAIPGGSFMMGSRTFEESQPIHKVNIKPFYMGKYEVTRSQWRAVTQNNYHSSGLQDGNLPIGDVDWNVAKEFCQKLSKLTGKEYRLPSETEWEYAARAGSTGDYCFGNDVNPLPEYAWYSDNQGSNKDLLHPVGQKKPNAWGLYDMHGNVWEGCEDIWHKNYQGAPTDGSAWVRGGDPKWYVLRGGSRSDDRDRVRAVFRYGYPPTIWNGSHVGFRVMSMVRSPSQ